MSRIRPEVEDGEKLPTTVPYSAQTWTFGTSLAMVSSR